ncbi:27899_t:CDS:2, partial [Gigaspora margarita]
KTDLSTARHTLHTLSTEEILLEPYNYLLTHPGKEIRSKLIEAFDHWLSVPKDKLSAITTVVEMLHTASLLIDDVEDDSVLRRGVPAELLNLHRGQGMELYWRDTLTCPSEAEFIDMVSNKTGGLLRLAVRLMQQYYVPLVDDIGIHFQIRDDYMNLQSKKYADNKGFCEDLTEGKFSFPIIHSINSDPNDRRLINILKQHTTSIELKQYAVNIMSETGSFEYTSNYLEKTDKMVREKIEKLNGNPVLEKILDLLSIKDIKD